MSELPCSGTVSVAWGSPLVMVVVSDLEVRDIVSLCDADPFRRAVVVANEDKVYEGPGITLFANGSVNTSG